MSYIVALRRNADGLVRMVGPEVHGGAEWSEGSDYVWTDGNYGCDCNRSLFFGRAGDEREEDIIECECGSSAFTALYAELPDGSRVKIDE